MNIRRIVTFMTAVVTLLSAKAISSVGEWNIYPQFSGEYAKVIETPSKLYFLSLNNLYSYSPEDNETYIFNSSNKLSDNKITAIYYNDENHYLLCCYENANIDLVYDDGTVINMPDIKDAVMSANKQINDVFFKDNRIYLALDFGLVVYDDQRHEVRESGIYNINIDRVTIVDDKLLLSYNRKFYWADVDTRHNTFDRFKEIGSSVLNDIRPIGGNRALLSSTDNRTRLATFDFENSRQTTTGALVNIKGGFNDCEKGFYFLDGSNINVMDDEGNAVETIAIPEAFANASIAYRSGKTIWAGDAEGIGRFDISGATPTVLNDKYRPEAMSVGAVAGMMPSRDHKRLYIYNAGPTAFKTIHKVSDNTDVRQQTDILENGSFRDVAVVNATLDFTKSYQNRDKNTAMYGGVTGVVEDPDDSEIYYCANGLEGLFVVRGNEQIHRFNATNSPLISAWGANNASRVFDVKIDKAGNLWAGVAYRRDNTKGPYFILPAAKRRNIPNVTAEDWVEARIPSTFVNQKDFQSLFCEKSNVIALFTGAWEGGIILIDTKGTYANPADDETVHFTSFTDQDGASVNFDRHVSMIEDARGRIWVGTTSGVYEITNPAASVNPTARISRIKVPRNDGTNYADYLLESDQINAMAVDPSNRKWIATEASGVYLVSENGDKIIEHFDVNNSPLPSNAVYSVYCDPEGNMVYFGTAQGLISYRGTSSPGKDDYSEVYAYPNPVRPDYHGWITVTGLMENSLVKIADAAGNVFHQGRSEGGMFTWDGCNASGERVRSGVYFVFASQSEDGGSESVVTKILVVN